MNPWYALRVRTAGESRSKTVLENKGYEVFLPTFLDCRHYSDRIKKLQSPLFPGYLFCRLDTDFRLPVLTTVGVESIISFAGVPCPVEEHELDAVRKATLAKMPVNPWPYLASGDHVMVEFGSLAGTEGILVRTRGADRLVISVNLLQQSVSVEIDRAWVRPVKMSAASYSIPGAARAAAAHAG